MSALRKLIKKGFESSQKIVPLRQKQAPLTGKMSEVLLEFAEPLLKNSSDDEFDIIIGFASLCWNSSFLPKEKQSLTFEKYLIEVPNLDPSICCELNKKFQMLLERKQKFFINDNRIITNFTITCEGKNRRLMVLSSPIE